MDRSVYQSLIARLLEETRSFYGRRLVTLALYGSYARNDMREDSDLDLLIIVEDLARGRMRRMDEFLALEKKLDLSKKELAAQKLFPYLSPILKTSEEASRGSPLFLDMTQEIVVLYDREDFFRGVLDRLRERLKELGSQRVWKGKMWYWVLKPDIKPGEIITL